MGNKKILSPEQSAELLKLLQTRFEKNMHRQQNGKNLIIRGLILLIAGLNGLPAVSLINDGVLQ